MWIRDVHIFVVHSGKPVHRQRACATSINAMNTPAPHIGALIREELRRQQKTNVWLARQIGVAPRTVNKIFDKEHIDTYQLLRISRCLHTDFFKIYSDLLA